MKRFLVLGILVLLIPLVNQSSEQTNPNFTVLEVGSGLPLNPIAVWSEYEREVRIVQAGLVENSQLEKLAKNPNRNLDDLEWVYSGEKGDYSMCVLVANWSDTDVQVYVKYRMLWSGGLQGNNTQPETLYAGTIKLFAYNVAQPIHTYWAPGMCKLIFTLIGRDYPGMWIYQHEETYCVLTD